MRFTYDVNGLLEVQAKVLATGAEHQLVIEQNPGLLSPQEIERRLRELAEIKIHPRELQGNIALLARAARIYEEHTAAVRHEIGVRLLEFKAALETQQPQRIEAARDYLGGLLDQLEGDSSPLLP